MIIFQQINSFYTVFTYSHCNMWEFVVKLHRFITYALSCCSLVGQNKPFGLSAISSTQYRDFMPIK
ncbi:hypothetical protein D3C78_1797940 [compost metagenome]